MSVQQEKDIDCPEIQGRNYDKCMVAREYSEHLELFRLSDNISVQEEFEKNERKFKRSYEKI